jgi:hypothetical protein
MAVLDADSQLQDALAQLRVAQRKVQEMSDAVRTATERIDALMAEVAAAQEETADARAERDKQADRDAIRIADLEAQIASMRAEKDALQEELKTSGLNLYDQHSIASVLDKRWKALKTTLDAQEAQNAQAKVILDRDGGYIAFEQKCREKIDRLTQETRDAEAQATIDRKELAEWLSVAESKAEATMAELERARKETVEKHAEQKQLADEEFQAKKELLARDLAIKRDWVEQEKAALDAKEKHVREECHQRMAILKNRVELNERHQQKKWELEESTFDNRVKAMQADAEKAAERYQARIRAQNTQLKKETRECEGVLSARRALISKHDHVARTYGLTY